MKRNGKLWKTLSYNNNKRLSERQIKRVIKINMKIVKASFK
jgi:hypothetical protein